MIVRNLQNHKDNNKLQFLHRERTLIIAIHKGFAYANVSNYDEVSAS